MIGTTFQKYRILTKLGEGGMGEVYLVEDTKLYRKAALKILSPLFTSNPDFKARSYREARAAAALSHPNIVTVYDVGEYDNRSYIAMEYVEGGSLKNLMTQGRPPIKKVAKVVIQICEGLNEAHHAGIVHRDIKPTNILIDFGGRVKIADFGLAQMAGDTKLTKTGTIMGTISYMSPEQVRGEKLDPRSDIFSLGVVLYEMLTGDLPFKGEGEYTVMNAIVHERPKALARYKLDIPTGMQEIIDKALQKNRQVRYQSIEELLIDFRYLEGLYLDSPLLPAIRHALVTTPLKKIARTTKRFLKRRRMALVAISVLLLIILALLLVPRIYNNLPVSSRKSQLFISTVPESAAIFLNGDSIGITPTDISPIKDGTFLVRLQKQDYFPADKWVTILKDETTTVFYQLQPMAKITIIVDPPEAEVAVDGKTIESSSLANLQLSADKHFIRISAEGYEPKDDEFTLVQGMNPTLTFSLDKITSSSTPKTQPEVGTIQITSEPSGASVLLNNKIVGKSPYFDKNVPTGDYQLIIRHVGYEDFSQNIAVRPGKTTPVMAKLMAVGELSIASDPAGASILLNGNSAGQTPYTNNKISAGQYNILLRKMGYDDYSTIITVGPRQPIEINIKLTALIGKLTILVRPFGSIYIDGNIIRRDTNIQFTTELPIGPRQIKVVHPQLGVWEKTVNVQTDSTCLISINFNKEAAVTVTSYNESGEDLVWGDVYVDGKPTGKTTPTQLKLRVGQHAIEVRREGYVLVSRVKVFNLDDDIKEPLVFRLKKVE